MPYGTPDTLSPLRGRLTDGQSVRRYLLGDWNAEAKTWITKTVTLESAKTGQRYTFKVSRPPGEGASRPWLVKVLYGPDNRRDYVYVGQMHPKFTPQGELSHVVFQHTPKSAFPASSKPFQAWNFLTRSTLHAKGKIPKDLAVYHEGKCGRCGRKLTVPESVSSGLGPICIKRVGR